jgi:hypothetical protein
MVISQVKVKFANNEREFFVSRSVAMMKISLPSGAVKVEGRMTKEEQYVQLSGVKANLDVSDTAEAGITTYEVAGMYSIKLTNNGAPEDGVVSTLIG